jgi:uncharacterized membrane protein YgdD (TMEM256/DUF423 family)
MAAKGGGAAFGRALGGNGGRVVAHEAARLVGEQSVSAFAAGGFLAAIGVLLGAFGAHALRDIGAARLAWWTTATQYLFIAAFGIMLSGLFDRAQRIGTGPATALLAGAILFCGSLYTMALGGPRGLGAVTPMGGIALAAGFAWIAIRALGSR